MYKFIEYSGVPIFKIHRIEVPSKTKRYLDLNLYRNIQIHTYLVEIKLLNQFNKLKYSQNAKLEVSNILCELHLGLPQQQEVLAQCCPDQLLQPHTIKVDHPYSSKQKHKGIGLR